VEGIVRAWGRILTGYQPILSIEITRECPLSCPGCYAYGSDHLGGALTLRQLSDRKGSDLVDGVLSVVRRYRPLHLSIVGGEPLVRYRELETLLPRLADMGIYTQVVTSAVRPIPPAWASLRRLHVVVSVDGLQPEHDERRKPATYERILKHIDGQRVTIHCTVTRQQARREGHLEEFVRFWSDNKDTRQIWVSLYTPRIGERSEERLTEADRARVVSDLATLVRRYPKLGMREGLLKAYLDPPRTPDECIFAKTTTCLSADLTHPITPCQLGGTPDCADCGCMASAGMAAVARHTLPGGLRVGTIFDASFRVGTAVRRMREAVAGRTRTTPTPDESAARVLERG